MIVEFTLQQPTLLEALQQSPSTKVTWEQMDTTANGEQLVLFWAASDDYEAFEAGIHEDPTVTGLRCLTEFSDRRLYQVEQIGEGLAQSVYPALVEAGGIIQQCTATAEGWKLQVRFPDTEALTHFHDACTRHDLDFRLLRKYQQADDNDHPEEFGLTAKQRELLVHAVEEGYYEVPRDTNLEDISETVDISHQAGSERLRRAMSLLVRNALSLPPASEEESETPQGESVE